jgi:uncharacterized membrane protein YkgB
VWVLLGAGTAIRLLLAFVTDGQPYDVQSFELLRGALEDDPLNTYETLNVDDRGYRWPYPAGYMPLALLSGLASDVTGIAYSTLNRIPAIVADAGIALLVHDFLRRGGASERVRLAAVAHVMLGPSFIVVSGHHGQIDSVAILPAVAAIAVWQRAPESRRALYAGLLIGAGGAIKTTPLVMVLALLPAVRSRREAVTLLAAAVAVPLVVTLPFILATPDAVRHALGYRGFPGTSGLSLLLQPDLAEQLTRDVPKSGAVEFLHERGQLLVVLTLVAVTALTRRLGVADRAAVLWLAFYVVTPVFFFQYLVWGLPFLLMAGRLRLALAIQAVALPATLMFYLAPWESDDVAVPYWLGMIALWALLVVSLGRLIAGTRRGAEVA